MSNEHTRHMVDGHRLCLYCEMLEPATWPHPYPPEPWLCHHCLGRSYVDSDFARLVAGQVSYSAGEIMERGTQDLVKAALQYYTQVWYATEDGRAARKEWEFHDLPF